MHFTPSLVYSKAPHLSAPQYYLYLDQMQQNWTKQKVECWEEAAEFTVFQAQSFLSSVHKQN